jgi:protein-disulfide isomerase
MTKEMSKRQQRREKMRRAQQRTRLFIIGGVTLVAVVIAILLILPNLPKPVGEIATPVPREHPQAQGTAMGDSNAKVKVDVFEDFQCPSCRAYSQEIEPQLISTYVTTGKVYYVFHNYPFIDSNTVTKESHQAANGSMCANEQGKFWQYHDLLFANWNGENQGTFNDNFLLALAGKIDGLDVDAFTTCFKENRYKDDIQSDFDLGQQMGVSGTPSVFVNGQIVRPGFIPQFSDLQQAIDAVLNQ